MAITQYKHINVTSDTTCMTEYFDLVTKRTRAGHNGKTIMCPHCQHQSRVYHFSFAALKCTNCTNWVDKYDWLVDQLDTWRTPR